MKNTDWPYLESPSKSIENSNNWPKISIITPSYNQGHFIEETILSVINQNYPNLEYIIIDGGSTDDTVEIIKKYEHKLTYWISEKDNGQTQAINKGFEQATGEIFAYLNSDDCYYANTLFSVANLYLQGQLKKDYLFIGNCYWANSIHDKKGKIDRPSFPTSLKEALIKRGLASQPSMFWTMRNQKLKFYEALCFCMDFEFWLQLISNKYIVLRIDQTLSFFRNHNDSKTNNLQNTLHEEIQGVISIYLKKLNYKDALEVRLLNHAIENQNLSYHLLQNLEGKSLSKDFLKIYKADFTILTKIKILIKKLSHYK